ncbi:Hpt domain-containing protein [Blastococcus colisei]|uniref:Hpt domain-containing protein n=1 Tax=Blastococcus colisei TaxID=1564162 RepID=A0A543PJL5_9ACTN|nr:response regulator [Blastococcus colisei]TQN44268.1 Hpt domain-containing protein [Blastococcus colisei]
MLTALVVDDEADARRRVAGLLRLGGWQVREAADAESARRVTAADDVDLVVTDVSVPGGTGPAMLRRMRHDGSRARFLVVTTDPTDEVRADAITAGAMACLAKPVGARILLDFLRSRTTGPAAQDHLAELRDWADLHDEDVDAGLMDRLHEMYLDALPARLRAIASGTRSGNAPAVVSAAHTLAGTSGQFGHPEVASICQAIAADARRGVMAHARVVELQELAQVS